MRTATVALALCILFATTASAIEPKDRWRVGAAFEAAAAGDYNSAFRHLDPVADPLPRKTIRWLRMVEGEHNESFDEIARFLLVNPHWPEQEELQIIAENRIREPVDQELIRRFFADRRPLTQRGHIRYADALLAVGEVEKAKALIRLVWIDSDFSRKESKRFYRVYKPLLTGEDHIARLHTLLWDYRRSSATRMLELVPESHQRLAKARMRLQRRAAGVDGAIRAVPGRLRSDPGLVFDRLRWRRQKGRHTAAIEILLDPPAELGEPGMWWFEREYQIRRALRARNFGLAHRLASTHQQTEGIDFAEAEWLAGWLALRFENQPRTALRHFSRLYEQVERPISRGRAAYWAGRAAGRLANAEMARGWFAKAARYDITFYGQLAAAELGSTKAPRPPAVPSAAARLDFETRETVRVARLLIGVGAQEELAPFLLRLVDDSTDLADVELVGELAAASGWPHLVTLAGKSATHANLVSHTVAFPIPDLPAFLDQPRGYPHPALVLGVARQESLFDPFAQSGAGARGLVQLMPRTAALMAREVGETYNRARLSGDPAHNVRLGSYYLKKMLDRYREPALALAAYNAGPSRVNTWLRLHGDPRGKGTAALVDWIELIPFDETRNYVQRVLENYAVYERRLREPEPVLVAMRPIAGPIDPWPVPVFRPKGAGGPLVSGPDVLGKAGRAERVALEAGAPRAAASSPLATAGDGPVRGALLLSGRIPVPKLKPKVLLAAYEGGDDEATEPRGGTPRPTLKPQLYAIGQRILSILR